MALGFCSGDESFYEELLSDFVSGYGGKKKELEESFLAHDWHECEVKIHALKSTAKTVGARELSELAMQIEEAAERKDEGEIMDRYPIFMSMYDRLVKEIALIQQQDNGELGE